MINEKIELGKINTLRIDRFTETGTNLMAEKEEDIHLPGQYIKREHAGRPGDPGLCLYRQ